MAFPAHEGNPAIDASARWVKRFLRAFAQAGGAEFEVTLASTSSQSFEHTLGRAYKGGYIVGSSAPQYGGVLLDPERTRSAHGLDPRTHAVLAFHTVVIGTYRVWVY